MASGAALNDRPSTRCDAGWEIALESPLGLPGAELAGREIAAAKVLQQFADANHDQNQRPITPEDPEHIDMGEVLDQEHRSDGNQNQRTCQRSAFGGIHVHSRLLSESAC